MSASYRILMLGDFHYGESYSKAGARVLAQRGYNAGLHELQRFIEASDHVIFNLETPLVDPDEHPSPYRGVKKYIHWADGEKTPKALRDLGVDAVNLANNHTLDHGEVGIFETFKHLEREGIPWFGAGRTLTEAQAPYTVTLPTSLGGGRVAFFGMFQQTTAHEKNFAFYARADKPGCAPLNSSRLTPSAYDVSEDDVYKVAFPHWGINYSWRTKLQRKLASDLHDCGIDLVVGHGSHCVQELELINGRWTVFGIGNGHFQSGGRYQKYMQENSILPFSFWTILEFSRGRRNGNRDVFLKLYPVYSDNSSTGFTPKPVSPGDFTRLVESLIGRHDNAKTFANQFSGTGEDDLGFYICLGLGEWPDKASPTTHKKNLPKEVEQLSRTQNVFPRGPVGDYADPVRQEVVAGKSLSSVLIARAAERDGADTEWLSPAVVLAKKGERRVLINGGLCTETVVGGMIASNKALTSELLIENGVSAPRGKLVHHAEEAVSFQRSLGSPVVVKPNFGQRGRGISVNLSDAEEISEAFYSARKINRDVLVQEFLDPHEEYRCLVTSGECVSVVKRVLPSVVGDGRSTIRELIGEKNKLRRLSPHLYKHPIPVDNGTVRHLASQGRALDEVLEEGAEVVVRNVGGVSSGGEPHECADVVSQAVKDTASAVAAVMPGLPWAAVDIITTADGERPYVIEVNTSGGLGGHHYPVHGPARDVAGLIWSIKLASAPADEETPTPETISGFLEGSQLTDKADFSALMQQELRSRGFTIKSHVGKIWEARSAQASDWYFDCWTTDDVSIVRRTVNRHGVVRNALKSAKVPMVRARRIKRLPELRAYAVEKSMPVVATPVRGSWAGKATQVISGPDDVKAGQLAGHPRWVVQGVPTGSRIRVFASPKRPLLALGDSELDEKTSVLVLRCAVAAVRALPLLRWAAVDVFIGEDGRVLVEGMSVPSTLEAGQRILFGTVGNVVDEMLTTSSKE